MKIFLSWSGTRSKVMAQALRTWLPDVLHIAEPWMSDKDIEAGSDWNQQLSTELAKSNFAVMCLTRENMHSNWMAYEAGACVNKLDEKRVCPVLLDIQPSELTPGPFAQFQAIGVDKVGVLKLVHAINRSARDRSVEEYRINRSFEKWWPELEEHLMEIKRKRPPLNIVAGSNRLNLIESFSDFLKNCIDMIESAQHRFLVFRRYSAGSSQGEEEYFEVTRERLLSRKLPVYRRLVNVVTHKNAEQVKWMLDKFSTVGPLEIKVWSEPEFPTNYELIIGDSKAVLAFSSGGAPQRGIIVCDGQIVEYLVGLFDQYWNDKRAVNIKSSEMLITEAVENAKSQVQKVYENLSHE